MGGRPLEAMALIGIGINRLSITPAGIGPIKAMICSLGHADITAKMEAMLADPPPNFREALAVWAIEHGVEIG